MEHSKRELAQLAEQLQRQKKLQTMLASLQEEEQGLLQKEQQLLGLLNKEDKDVERLEKTTAASLFYAALGKKEERLEKEQQEACAARLKYDAALRQLDDCRRRIRSLTEEQQALAGCQSRYDALFEETQRQLHQDPKYGRQLCELEQQLGEAAGQLNEVAEAARAGGACLNQIERIESSLNSAEGWGTFDILGGGLIADVAKHSHLNEAQANAEQLQSLLSRFKTELADVKLTAQMGQVNVEGLLLFADYFFDGLIADWCVLSRIHDSQHSVSQVKVQVVAVLEKLASIHATLQGQKASLERRLQELVQDA